MPTWFTKAFTAGEVLAAAALNQFRDNFIILDQHAHTGLDGEGAATLDGASMQGYLDDFTLWMFFPKSEVGFDCTWLGAEGDALNDEIVFPVGLRAGSWQLTAIGEVASNFGIVTAALDGTDIGTMDFYLGAASNDLVFAKTISFTVATSGWKDFRLKITGKNASSSAHVIEIAFIKFNRTGA